MNSNSKGMASPKEILTNHGFMGSVFRNSECETILRNIILLQKSANPDEWTPFSWEDYKAFCTHPVSIREKGVLDAFVVGGRPVWNTSASVTPGWLDFDEDTLMYSFTPKMQQMLSDNYADKSLF